MPTTVDELNAWAKSYVVNSKRRTHTTYAFTVAAVLVLAFLNQRAQSDIRKGQQEQRQFSIQQCEQRKVSILAANKRWAALAEIDRTNKGIDDGVRLARLHVYSNAQTLVPDCTGP